MNGEIKANDTLPVSSTYPSAVLGAGNLASIISERGSASRFSIFRADRYTGRVSNLFTPRDVADLAKLATLIAKAYHEDDQLEDELRDDLGCLAHCLEEVFPPKEEHERFPDQVARSFFVLMNAFIAEQANEFTSAQMENHVYRHLLLIDAWFRGVPAHYCQLGNFASFINPPLGFGLCPICGNNEGVFFEQRKYWFFCHDHQLRWLGGENIVSDFCVHSLEDNVWGRIRQYRSVAPYVSMQQSED